MYCIHEFKSQTAKKKIEAAQQGLSLVEAIVSMLILFAIMSGLIPIFMGSRLKTIENDIRTGAISISKEILDELRQDKNVKDWPLTGNSSELPNGTIISNKQSKGRTYSAKVIYCQDSNLCGIDSTRQVTLEINHNGKTIYNIQTIYTQLQ